MTHRLLKLDAVLPECTAAWKRRSLEHHRRHQSGRLNDFLSSSWRLLCRCSSQETTSTTFILKTVIFQRNVIFVRREMCELSRTLQRSPGVNVPVIWCVD